MTETIKDAICYMCTSGCPTKVHVKDGKAVKIDIADKNAAHCPRWKAQLEFIYHPERLVYPMKRTGARGSGEMQRISWDEALDAVAAGLQKAKDKYGPESAVFWSSYSKEPRPYFHRLAHAFGSPNYCTESSSCFSAAWLAAHLTYGPDYAAAVIQSGAPDPATKCRIVWGASIVNSGPRGWQAALDAVKKGQKLIVVDPRRSALAEKADIHLQLIPGTDGALALGMVNVIIGENLHDKDFLTRWTNDFEGLRKLAAEYTLEHTAAITGVPAEKIKQAAVMYATLKPSKVQMSANSTTHHSNGVQNHRAILMLPAVTGNVEVAGGNRAVPYPNRPTHVNDITLHERIEDMPPGVGSQRFPIWTERYAEMQSNAVADQIESGLPYPLKAMLSAGLNVQFFPNSARFVEMMNKLDFICVSEYFPTPGTRLADIVLPIASWLERPMLFPDMMGFVKLFKPPITPVGECRPEWDIYAALAERLGFGDLFWHGNFTDCVNHIVAPMNITYKDLQQHPEGFPTPGKPKAEKYYEQDGFGTPSGKIEVASTTLALHGQEPLPAYREMYDSLSAEFPLVLTSGARVLAYTHSQFRQVPSLRKLAPEPVVDINPADAAPRGIQTGDAITVSSPRNSIRMKANVTDTILPGAVNMLHGWPDEANVNLLVDDKNLDPISGFPPYKSQACQVAKS